MTLALILYVVIYIEVEVVEKLTVVETEVVVKILLTAAVKRGDDQCKNEHPNQ